MESGNRQPRFAPPPQTIEVESTSMAFVAFEARGHKGLHFVCGLPLLFGDGGKLPEPLKRVVGIERGKLGSGNDLLRSDCLPTTAELRLAKLRMANWDIQPGISSTLTERTDRGLRSIRRWHVGLAGKGFRDGRASLRFVSAGA